MATFEIVAIVLAVCMIVILFLFLIRQTCFTTREEGKQVKHIKKF